MKSLGVQYLLSVPVQRAQVLLAHAVRRIPASWPASPAHSALGSALVTPPAAMSAAVRARLAALIARFL